MYFDLLTIKEKIYKSNKKIKKVEIFLYIDF